MNTIMLQQLLETIQKNGYVLPQNIDLNQLSIHMLEHIGTLDGYLRDQLIYSTFSHLISRDYFLEAQLEKLLMLTLEEKYLYYGITSDNANSVFTRSFTTLLIALILCADNKTNFLTQETIVTVKEKLVDYMNMEIDLRGYVQPYGWAHSIAHASDAFDALIHNPKLAPQYYEELAHCLLNKIFVYSIVYHFDEDERIITPLLSMVSLGFSQKQLFDTIRAKLNLLPLYKTRLPINEYCNLCSNVKTFLRSLYFRTVHNIQFTYVASQAEVMLKELPTFY
ncbi:hypothetical protein BACCIP111899_04297 [Bacillus rhizoplanae]|uniref:DUF2785 domain-containing protein n=1 Tax=Bacillus rhizoplanae TaxID=2880966 RepID=A0ABN8A7N0_9BACI|nr:DUF2785 domain-containing protein [Bacillus rhizoplanae]CAG9615061.1 hypothetical protein BACCIP111899_04297 [Bacillus rhizoplanae]